MDDKERWEKEKEELQFLLKLALAREKEKGFLTDEDIDDIICDRLKEKDEEEVLKEYLVDNALLTCTSASWWDFKLLYDGRVIKTERLPDKVMSGEPTTFLKVCENDMYTDGFRHATVADTKQGLNIKPFPCNCMEFANEDEEKEIVENIEECEKTGVCQYLMDLEDEWENIVLDDDDVSYKEFSNVDPDRGLNIGSVNVGTGQNEMKQGITMTSVLFCKHGGFIYPVRSGQTDETARFQFTLEQLKGCGWETATEEDVKELNAAMQRFGVISRESAYMMLATMLGESGCTVKIEGGRDLMEKLETAEREKDEVWQKYIDDLRKKGNTVGEYSWRNRGAGYMQITGESLQQQFLEYMNDSFDGQDKATYIGNNYPIDSAVWYWTEVKKTEAGNLNAYVTENGAWEGMFLITQYFVNGFPTGHDDTLRGIKKKEYYEIKEGKVYSNGDSFGLPNGWDNRSPIWNRIEEYMNNEE